MAGIRQFKRFCEFGANVMQPIKEEKRYKTALSVLEEFRSCVLPNRPARATTSRSITPKIKAEIFKLFNGTDLSQQQIARKLRINQGRVNETLQGHI